MHENTHPLTMDLLEIVNAGLEAGLGFPLTVVFVGANGSVSASRFPGPGQEADPLCDHVEDPGFALPVNVLVVDPMGQTTRGVLESSGMPHPTSTSSRPVQ